MAGKRARMLCSQHYSQKEGRKLPPIVNAGLTARLEAAIWFCPLLHIYWGYDRLEGKEKRMSFTELVGQNMCWRTAAPARPRLWKKGHKFNDDVPQMFFVVSGRVRLMALAEEGGEKTLWYLRDGCCFNETPLFAINGGMDMRIMGDARFYHECVEDSYLCAFSVEDVLRLGARQPELLLNLCHSFSFKVTLLSQQVVSLSLESQMTRVCKFLASRIVPGSQPLRARRDMSYREMADLLGMHRISLYKILRQAQGRGLLRFDKNSEDVLILQPAEFFKEAHLPPAACGGRN